MKKRRFIATGVMLISGLAMTASAAVILENDFDTDTTGFTLSGTDATLTNNTIRLDDNSITENAQMVSDTFNPNAASNVVVSFDYYSNAQGGQSHAFELSGDGSTQGILLHVAGGSSQIQNRESSAFVNLTPNFTMQAATWYNFKFTLPPETTSGKTFDLQVTQQGQPAGNILDVTDQPFRNEIGTYDFTKWFFNTAVSASGGDYIIDNVVISNQFFDAPPPPDIDPGDLVKYTFSASNTVADATASNVSASAFTADSGYVNTTVGGGASTGGFPLWQTSADPTTASITLTPDDGYSLGCSALLFGLRMDGTAGGRPYKVELTSSATGTNVLFEVYNKDWATEDGITSGGNVWALVNNQFKDITVDLTQWPELLTNSTVTFTWDYFEKYAAANGQWRMDDIYVEGSAFEYTGPGILAPYSTNITSIVDEDFNGTPGTLLILEEFDTLPTNSWTFNDNGAVATNTGPNAVDPFGTPGASLNLDMTAAGVPDANVDIQLSGDDADQPLKIEFSFNPADFSAAHEFALRNSGGTPGIQMDLANSSGQVRYHNGTAMTPLGVTLDEGSWYQFKIVTSPESNASGDTFDLTILNTNNVTVFSTNGLSFRNDLADYDHARFYFNTGSPTDDGQFYIDNVYIRAVPDAETDSGAVFSYGSEVTGPESAFFPTVGGGLSAELKNSEINSNPEVDVFFTVDDPNRPLHIVFDYRPETAGTKNFGFRLVDNNQLDDTSSFDTQGMDGMRMMQGATVGLQNKPTPTDSWVQLGITPVEGQWHTVEIIASPESAATKTFDITVWDTSGAVIGSATNQPFRSDITNYTSFGFFFNRTKESSDDKAFYIDNLKIGNGISQLTAYEQWAEDNGLTSGNDDETDNPDGDVLNNKGEYVFGGSPTNGADVGVGQEFDAGGAYVYTVRNDTDLTVQILTRANLMFGEWATNSAAVISVDDGELGTYTNAVGIGGNQLFYKLLVE
ncbi:hypothetical protein PDESU_03708 [Pontiella desulfatans]|uniref:DUF11 domain-containing protein n=1 Tax=Pontiella desulfatans TaxID=2750659 RepID=A0A6C2U5P1_PONDE|nr:hypothetical protein [Pontiella desulfatans]VGO15127.1 hypothetical protein PDESU_03708 [Pontiella desulfatans]